MQIQLCLGQLRLRLFKAGFGLGNVLRAVTGGVLAYFILRGCQRRLRLVAGCPRRRRQLSPA